VKSRTVTAVTNNDGTRLSVHYTEVAPAGLDAGKERRHQFLVSPSPRPPYAGSPASRSANLRHEEARLESMLDR
jgi:hypothetical protein